jgi:hypothetical protein
MTLFLDGDLADVPLVTNWTIVQGDRGPPLLCGTHVFHEGQRAVCVEIAMTDPLLRWVIGADGAYRLSGLGTGAVEKAGWPHEKSEGH